MSKYQNQRIAAAKSGMSERTARKYLKTDKLPSDFKKERGWKTRKSALDEIWSEVESMLHLTPDLYATTILAYLKEKHPEKIKGSHLRTLQHRIKIWRSEKGSEKEVIFAQEIYPGRQSQSDYTCMNKLKVTINGNPFPHLLFHFMLPYSRWEDAKVCFSESYESLISGYEQAVWRLGKAAPEHRTDNQSAIRTIKSTERYFTQKWKEFMGHYQVKPTCNNPGKGHENGSVEKSHDLLKKALDQALMLRGTRDFESQEAYEHFINKNVQKRNAERQARVVEEIDLLKDLPEGKYRAPQLTLVRVSRESTVRIKGCVYSVPSRLIGYQLKACVYAEEIDLYYSRRLVQRMKRETGSSSSIDYRHIINQLVKKPGAFEHYKYKDHLFPQVTFRKAYDRCREHSSTAGHKIYLNLLQLAFLYGERRVENVLKAALKNKNALNLEEIKQALITPKKQELVNVNINAPHLSAYNQLLSGNTHVTAH
jgi:transposase